MALETGTTIDELVATNPTVSDPAGQGDDHLRLIKTVLKATFPQLGGIFGQVRTLSTSQTISSVYNTSLVYCNGTATLTLPPSASITAGWSVDLITGASGVATIAVQGSQSINGAASLAVPANSSAKIAYAGANVWYGAVGPGSLDPSYNNVQVNGTLSVSGVSTLIGLVNAKAGISVSGSVVMTGGLTVGGAATISGAATLLGSLSVAGDVVGSITFSGTTVMKNLMDLPGGQIKFPATQSASSDANTLDDYEEGTFTPTLTFDTPGNLAITYTVRTGNYTKIGRMVNFACRILTSSFTHSTASGNLRITGLPFTAINTTTNYSLATAYASGTSVGGADYSWGAAVAGNEARITPYMFNIQAGLVTNPVPANLPSGNAIELLFAGNFTTT